MNVPGTTSFRLLEVYDMGATWRKRGPNRWLVTVHSHGERQHKMVRAVRRTPRTL